VIRTHFVPRCADLQHRQHGGTDEVQIFGQLYSIQGDLDAAYVQRLAKYVDDKDARDRGCDGDRGHAESGGAGRAAIADELHSSQREIGEREEMLKEQAERCLTWWKRAQADGG